MKWNSETLLEKLSDDESRKDLFKAINIADPHNEDDVQSTIVECKSCHTNADVDMKVDNSIELYLDSNMVNHFAFQCDFYHLVARSYCSYFKKSVL